MCDVRVGRNVKDLFNYFFLNNGLSDSLDENSMFCEYSLL